eukprot:3101671-Pyramimonas_sp.AAC.1
MAQVGCWFQHPSGEPPEGYCTASQAVCLLRCPTSFVLTAVCEDVTGGALVSAPLRGAIREYCMGPFAASLWRCSGGLPVSVAIIVCVTGEPPG